MILANSDPHGNGDLATVEKRGGSGPDANLTPDPRTTANLNRELRVVR